MEPATAFQRVPHQRGLALIFLPSFGIMAVEETLILHPLMRHIEIDETQTQKSVISRDSGPID